MTDQSSPLAHRHTVSLTLPLDAASPEEAAELFRQQLEQDIVRHSLTSWLLVVWDCPVRLSVAGVDTDDIALGPDRCPYGRAALTIGGVDVIVDKPFARVDNAACVVPLRTRLLIRGISAEVDLLSLQP